MAAKANCLLGASTLVLIKLDANLRRPLKNMKELSKRKIEQRKDDCDLMQHGEEPIIQAMQQMG